MRNISRLTVLAFCFTALFLSACAAEKSNGAAEADTASSNSASDGEGEADSAESPEADAAATDPDAGPVDEIVPPDTSTVDPNTCNYPEWGLPIANGTILPPLNWPDAYLGQNGDQIHFDLHDFYCGKVPYQNFKTLLFVIVTEWCPACPGYLSMIDSIKYELYDAGMLVVYVMAQDKSYDVGGSLLSYQYVSKSIGNVFDIRVGYKTMGPNPPGLEVFQSSPFVTAFPTIFAVRGSDMKIIADQQTYGAILPFLQIANDPDADWNVSPYGGGCNQGDEEASEPNDAPKDAAPLAPGTVNGGVCSVAPDFYKIELEGDWTATINYDTEIGDLDLYIWDEDANSPMLDSDGNPVGAYSATGTDTLDFSGPAYLLITGFHGNAWNEDTGVKYSRAAYNLTLTEK